jgi:hypothetical protein
MAIQYPEVYIRFVGLLADAWTLLSVVVASGVWATFAQYPSVDDGNPALEDLLRDYTVTLFGAKKER